MAGLRGWITLNESDCFSPTSRADFYRKAEVQATSDLNLFNRGMLKTNWHQGWPFNSFRSRHKNRDMDYHNQRNAAGCAVVALAHLFYYYKDTPEVQRTLGSYVNKLQTSYPMKLKDGKLTVTYEKGHSLDEVKSFAKYIHKNFLYGCLTSKWGSSGIPRENETLFGKGKHLGLKSVLKEMRNSAKPKDFKRAAKLIYEAVVLNRVPVLIWLQRSSRTNGHFCIIDGCNVNTQTLLTTRDFEKSCEFHFHKGNVHISYPDLNNLNWKEYEESVEFSRLSESFNGDFSRVRKVYFYSSAYRFDENSMSTNECSLKLESGRNLKDIYYKITNQGKTKVETGTKNGINAYLRTTIKTKDGKQYHSEYAIVFEIEPNKTYIGYHSFSSPNINQITEVILELSLTDNFGNSKTLRTYLSLKPLKASEVQQQYPVQKVKRVRQSDGTWAYPKV